MRQVYEYHPVIGYRFIPNLKARIPHEGGGYLLEANEIGFRSNRPFCAPATPGFQRVLMFGDSFTAGDAVANEQRYSDLIEKMLQCTEVYNFGLSSTGTDQQYLAWREYARAIDCDVIVIAVFVENVRRVMARFRPHRDAHGVERLYAKPYFTLEDGNLALHQVPPPAHGFTIQELQAGERAAVDTGGRFPALRKLATAIGAREVLQRMTHYQPLPEYDSPDSTGWSLMRAILTQWIRGIDRPVVLMPLPLPQHLDEVCDPRPYQDRFRELAKELDCVLHDPMPDLLNYEPAVRRRFRWQTDIHFTPQGHRAIADSLAPVLARLLAHSS